MTSLKLTRSRPARKMTSLNLTRKRPKSKRTSLKLTRKSPARKMTRLHLFILSTPAPTLPKKLLRVRLPNWFTVSMLAPTLPG
jgi:hypothetical protein